MRESIDNLVRQYEAGSLTRRELLAAITLLVAPKTSRAQDSILQARSFNHVNIRVNDVSRSEAFYRKVLGLPTVRSVVGGAFGLDLPDGGFISLCPISEKRCGMRSDAQPGSIDHFGIGIDDFAADRVVSKLTAAGFQRVVNATTSVFVPDPDGTIVQLSAADQYFAG